MSNRLADETSPYLLQHADNPVDWYPWGDEALAAARRENKPILLSVGYSACHWCHVMAHESFEDAETADLMNRLFINIKVDREERPDLDKIYQLAHSALTRRGGGWPLTMFLTPDQVPFFGGTYFPKEPRHGMPAFKDILQKVAAYLESNPGDIKRQNNSLLEFLATLEQADHRAGVDVDRMRREVIAEMEHHFDATHGGFGQPPKFPQVPALDLALRLGTGSNNPRVKHMAVFTLRKMTEGGIQDQLGGGFFRYSVDESWTVPHFEKMLYDNGLLLDCYSRAWRITGEPAFEQAAAGIVRWLLDEMRDPGGGFYAALDADSEGDEGRYYVWTPEQVKAVLDESDYALFAGTFGLDRPPNFEQRWHLRIRRNPADVGAELDLNSKAVDEQLAGARQTLLQHRRERVPPERDHKILTAWNALVVKGLTTAGLHFARTDWIDAAQAALNHIHGSLWDGRRLSAVYTDGEARFNGYLDDYAFLLDALLQVLQARWRTPWLEFAQSLANVMLQQFYDDRQGGFFFTAADHEALIHRPKSLADESTPAGSMVAAVALLKLGHLTGNTEYLDSAAAALERESGTVLQAPLAHGTAVKGLIDRHHPPTQIILRGDESAMQPWQQQARRLCGPWTDIYAIANDETGLPATLARKTAKAECTAYICQGTHCSEPVNEIDDFTKALNNQDQ